MVLRKGKGNWVYKRVCRRCGEIKNMGSKHGRICVDCVMPHYRSENYVKFKKMLMNKQDSTLEVSL